MARGQPDSNEDFTANRSYCPDVKSLKSRRGFKKVLGGLRGSESEWGGWFETSSFGQFGAVLIIVGAVEVTIGLLKLLVRNRTEPQSYVQGMTRVAARVAMIVERRVHVRIDALKLPPDGLLDEAGKAARRAARETVGKFDMKDVKERVHTAWLTAAIIQVKNHESTRMAEENSVAAVLAGQPLDKLKEEFSKAAKDWVRDTMEEAALETYLTATITAAEAQNAYDTWTDGINKVREEESKLIEDIREVERARLQQETRRHEVENDATLNDKQRSAKLELIQK